MPPPSTTSTPTTPKSRRNPLTFLRLYCGLTGNEEEEEVTRRRRWLIGWTGYSWTLGLMDTVSLVVE